MMQLDIADVLLSRSLQADMGGRLSISSMSSMSSSVVRRRRWSVPIWSVLPERIEGPGGVY